MICKKCGKQVEDTAVFCRYCGERVEYTDSIQKNINTNGVDSGSKTKNIGVVTCVLALTTIVFAILFFYSKSQNNELTSTLSESKKTIASYESEIKELTSEVNNLEIEVKNKTLPAETYDKILSFIKSNRGKLYNHYKNFYTASPVVFVKKGETLEINLSSSYYGTFWADSSELDNCRGEWGSTARIYKVTGKTVGTGIMHFETNSYEDHFYVMVVCYE